MNVLDVKFKFKQGQKVKLNFDVEDALHDSINGNYCGMCDYETDSHIDDKDLVATLQHCLSDATFTIEAMDCNINKYRKAIHNYYYFKELPGVKFSESEIEAIND